MTQTTIAAAPPFIRPDRGDRGWPAYVLPALLVALALTIYPVGSLIWTSLTKQGFDGNSFVGLDNYFALFRMPRFSLIVGNTVVWTLGTTIGAIVLGCIAALALQHKRVVLPGLWRSLLLLPWIVPQVASATIWKWFYSTEFGFLNHMLMQVGIIGQPVSWLTQPEIVMGAVATIQIWGTFPFVMLMVSAGLQTVDESVLEAARLDGATPWQEFVDIILPSLRGVLFIVSLIVVVWALNSFTTIWVMTQGGPAGRTSIFSIYIYELFRNFDLNRSAAASVLLLVVSLIFAVAYMLRIGKQR